MGKSETVLEHADAVQRGLLDIGQASKASGVSVKMIRHYEAIGLLKNVARTFANYRVYGEADVHSLRFVHRARSLGFPLKQVEALLSLWNDRGRRSESVRRLAMAHVAELDRKARELQSMADALRRLAHACHGDARPECPILEDLGLPGADQEARR